MTAQAEQTPRAEHYLRTELNELFRSDDAMWSFVQQGSLDGVWYWDLENPANEWMSPEMWRLLGIDPATKRHDPAEWQDLIFQDDLKVALENFQLHCADPSHPYDQIVRYRHADGSTVWVRCRGIAIRDAAGKPIRMLGAHNDYTPVKRAEETALAAQREIAAANEELRSFAYSTSHDLKAPSNTVGMILREIMEADEGGLNEDQRDLIGMASATIEHMRRLVEDLLSYTRLIGEELSWEPVPLGEVAEETRGLLTAAFAETGGRLTVGPLPEVPANRTQMGILFQNLIENALKFRHPDRAPEISVDCVDGAGGTCATIRVSDNGIGIDPAHWDRVFGLFKRLHRSDEIEGLGLGLTLCRRILLNHDGGIEVSSEPGRGTVFTIDLPRYRE